MGKTGFVMMVGQYISSEVVNKINAAVTFSRSTSLDDDDSLTETKSLLKNIEDRIPVIRDVIRAAEGHPIKSQTLSNWLKDVKNAAYEVDDLLDELGLEEIQQRAMNDRGKVVAFASSTVNFLKCLFVSDEKLKKLKSLAGNLDEIFDDVDYKRAELDYFITRDKALTAANRETSSFMADEVIGREKERDRILEMLLHSEDELDRGDKGVGSSNVYPSLRVLPIVGMGGVGKTALAQLIYNDQRIGNHFMRKWVYVSSHSFNVEKIMMGLIDESSTTNKKSIIFYDTIVENVKDAIWSKKLLFVLDDVGEGIRSSTWNKLRSALAFGAKGSTILVTTQSPNVAEITGNVEPIYLEALGQEAYWRLFEQCAFGNKEISPNLRDKLQLIGRKKSQKLHGLPLAGKAIGSLLRTRLEERFWITILESEWWEEDFVLSSILPSLGLSYQHLSANMKQCFAYTCIFPKGYVFQKDRLVQMWMAQGFIQSKCQGGYRLEDIGSQMFDELTKRHFFLPEQEGGYVIHDLIRELAVCVSSDECFVVNDDECIEVPTTIRHLSLAETKFDTLKELHKLQKLRSIIFFSGYDHHREFYHALENIFKSNKSLRVIDMSNCGRNLKKLPDVICDLPHLRYLDISHSQIQRLPKSIFRLCHLQVLKMNSCCILGNLPKGMTRLINLRHLYASVETISLIDGIGKLTNLQELEELHVSRKRGHRIGELKELRNIRSRLVIQNLENVESNEEAVEARLKNKEHLNQLALLWKPETENKMGNGHIIEGLEPNKNLKELTIEHFPGLIYPSWLVMKRDFTNLESLFLNNCIKCEVLPPLGQLSSLKILHIKNMPAIKRIGVEFYGDVDPAFPSLDELEFELLEEWKEWSDEVAGKQVLPRLHLLKIEKCWRLRKVPFVNFSSSLKVLQIWYCGNFDRDMRGCLEIQTFLVTLALHGFRSTSVLCLSNLTNLQFLELRDCPELRLNRGVQSLTNLKDMIVSRCPTLFKPSQVNQSVNERILPSLSSLRTDESLLDNLWIALGRVPSLRKLEISSCIRLNHWKIEQEEWFRQLTCLEDLKFENCINLVGLPNSLSVMHSLKRLEICNCPLIQSLPEDCILPLRLEGLLISGCPTLEERCIGPHGPDWSKIAHIPHIHNNYEEKQKRLLDLYTWRMRSWE